MILTHRFRTRTRTCTPTRACVWLSALVLPALSAGSVLAQNGSSVQVYGYLAPMVDHISVSGSTAQAPLNRPSMLRTTAYGPQGNGKLTRMQSATTNFGFRGSEDLGAGFKAIFQLEAGFGIDTGLWTGAPATGPARGFNRNSHVGLSTPWGTLSGGIWDTPSAWSHIGFTNGVRNPYAGDSSTIFTSPGFNIPHSVTADTRTNGPGDATFNRRQGNTLQYGSPNWGGFSFRLSYSLPEGAKTAANGHTYKPAILGLGAEYASGPVVLRYVYQQHRDFFGLAWIGPNPAANPDSPGSTARSAKDENHRLVARYVLNSQWTLQGVFDRLVYSAEGVSLGHMSRYSRNAVSAQVLYRHKAHTVWANAGRASDGRCTRVGQASCVTDGLGATNWALGYRHGLSRRTGVFASVYGVNNRANGQYGLFPRSVNGIAPGSRQTGLTLGMEHAF